MTGGASSSNHTIGDCSVVGTVQDIHGCLCSEQEAESLKVVFGILIHIVASVGINTGQNLQAMGLVRLDEAERNRCSSLVNSRLWTIGCALFITCSIVNFAALMLAPASILVPLEAVQFVVNVAFGKFVRKVHVPMRMLVGVGAMCTGVGLAVAFGERGTFCFDEEELRSFWTLPKGWAWWLYIAVTFGISFICLVAHNRCWVARSKGQPYRNSEVLMPILYAMPSALLGGGQMIVQSKTLSELFEIMATGKGMPLTDWFFWVELLLVSGFGKPPPSRIAKLVPPPPRVCICTFF